MLPMTIADYRQSPSHAALCTFLPKGLRRARLSDVDAVQTLLLPLEKEGVLVKRPRNELEAMMHDFIVIERETKVRAFTTDVTPMIRSIDA